jgi:hypothetical protein
MANRTWKGFVVKLDGSTGTLDTLSGVTNKVTLAGKYELLDDTSLNDEEQSFIAGLASSTVSINGFSNSTTDASFAPILGNRTTATRTLKVNNGNKWWQGEVVPSGIEISGAPNTLQLWSFTGSLDGLLSNTTS